MAMDCWGGSYAPQHPPSASNPLSAPPQTTGLTYLRQLPSSSCSTAAQRRQWLTLSVRGGHFRIRPQAGLCPVGAEEGGGPN